MTTEYQPPAPRYVSLLDYFRVLRRFWFAIAALVIIGAAAGYLYASRQTTSYRATAQVNFQDPAQALGIVGLASSSVESPGQVAAVAADLVDSPTVMHQVARDLRTPASAQALATAVSAQVSASSGLLEVSGASANSAFAVRLANTTAGVLVAQDNAQVRAQYAQLASNITRRISTITGKGHRSTSSATASELAFYQDELARLDTLAAYAKTATLAEPASQSSPISTSRSRSMLLGGLLGLLLGLIFAFVRDSLDGRVFGAQDVRQSAELPVLGYVRNRNMGRIPQLNGRSDKRRAEDVEAFGIARRNIELLDRGDPPKTILVTSPVAGEGKTTVAVSLALAMATAGRQTMLLECDLRRPSLAGRLNLESSPGLADYLAGDVAPPAAVRTIEFSERPANGSTPPSGNGHRLLRQLACVPAGSISSNPTSLLTSDRFRQCIEQVKRAYEVVVIDTTPLLPVSDALEVLPYVDAVVLCLRESRTTRAQVLAATAALSRFPDCPAGIVITGVRSRRSSYEVGYAYA